MLRVHPRTEFVTQRGTRAAELNHLTFALSGGYYGGDQYDRSN
jgi:hypothetical protein